MESNSFLQLASKEAWTQDLTLGWGMIIPLELRLNGRTLATWFQIDWCLFRLPEVDILFSGCPSPNMSCYGKDDFLRSLEEPWRLLSSEKIKESDWKRKREREKWTSFHLVIILKFSIYSCKSVIWYTNTDLVSIGLLG